MRSLIVLPTYQEAETVTTVLRRIRGAVPAADVLVVDDGSPDGTAGLARAAGAELGSIEVMRRASKTGLGSAYRDGMRWGIGRGYEILVEMDADLSHDPADLPRLIGAVEDGADLAVGSRYVAGGTIPAWSLPRRVLSRQGNRYAAALLRLPATDSTSGFRAYRATVVKAVDLDRVRADGYGFQIEMVRRVVAAGGIVVELPIAFTERTQGHSKMSTRIVVEALGLVTWWGLRDRLGRIGHRRERRAV